MSNAFVIQEPLERVADLLPIELSTIYTMRWRGRFPWLIKRGRLLFVDLLLAADFWEQQGRRHVAAGLRGRAAKVHAELAAQRVFAASLSPMEAAGQ